MIQINEEPGVPLLTRGTDIHEGNVVCGLPSMRRTRRLVGEVDYQAFQKESGFLKGLSRVLGLALRAEGTDQDPSPVTIYTADGTIASYRHLWLILLAMSLSLAAQGVRRGFGRVRRAYLTELLRDYYHSWFAYGATLLLLITHLALMLASLLALEYGLELLTGLSFSWFAVPVAFGLWYISVFSSFELSKAILLMLSLIFITFLIAAGCVQTGEGSMWPGFAAALLGALFAPCFTGWLIQEEKTRQRSRTWGQLVCLMAMNVAGGIVGGNLAAYALIVCTGTTSFGQHGLAVGVPGISHALASARDLCALGLIGGGLISILILFSSASYALNGCLDRGLGQAGSRAGFWPLLVGLCGGDLLLALLRVEPLRLMLGASALAGILFPALLVVFLIPGNARWLPKDQRMNRFTNVRLILAALIMLIVALLFCAGLRGQVGG
jgi:Mn2+/Fe2+ NRAMP family transporter